jgi:hypothetical protein
VMTLSFLASAVEGRRSVATSVKLVMALKKIERNFINLSKCYAFSLAAGHARLKSALEGMRAVRAEREL